MKYYRLNQIAMAVLGALLLIFGTRTIIDIAFKEHEPEKPGHEVAGAKPGETPAGAENPAGPDLGTLLASADPARGETAAAVCRVCHAFDKGAPSPIGPNLHDVVGRDIASVEGFNYSPALKAKEGDWTFEQIDVFIHKPMEFAQGTLMAFPGVADAQQRADVILFLRTKTDNPPPLPEPKAGPETAEGEAAGGKEEAAKPAGPDVIALVVAGDPAKGETLVAVCKVCHSFDKGAPSPIGPNLYGVVGRDIASVEGFNYSPALKAKEGDWTFEHLDAMIHKPMEFAPGTLMAFPGVADAKQRGHVLAFLRMKSDNPVPLPEVAPAEAPAEAPAAPAAEEMPAEAPAAPAAEEKPAEEPAAPATEGDFSKPSTSSQPQPAVPEESAETPAPAAEVAPAAAPAEGASSEPSTSSQPQPVYPDGAPE